MIAEALFLGMILAWVFILGLFGIGIAARFWRSKLGWKLAYKLFGGRLK